MFTGIVQALGQISRIEARGGDLRLLVSSAALDFSDVALGDSIATNGVCLTVTSLLEQAFWADVSRETLAHSTLPELKTGAAVNLEKALTPASRLGGHLVSGHVDDVGQIVDRYDDGRSVRLSVQAPAHLARYIAHKGSICVDGMSLTVNAVNGMRFELNIVPHTVSETICSSYRPGSRVNLEVDVIARYLERLLLGDKAADASGSGGSGDSGISETFLAEHGFR